LLKNIAKAYPEPKTLNLKPLALQLFNANPNATLCTMLVTLPLQPMVFDWRQNSPSRTFASRGKMDNTVWKRYKRNCAPNFYLQIKRLGLIPAFKEPAGWAMLGITSCWFRLV